MKIEDALALGKANLVKTKELANLAMTKAAIAQHDYDQLLRDAKELRRLNDAIHLGFPRLRD